MSRRRVKHATVGPVSVPIHRNGDRWAIAWRDPGATKRQRQTFPTEAAAYARAREIAAAIANGQADSLTLHGASRDEYRAAKSRAAAVGIGLHALVEDAAAAREILGPGIPLATAAEYYRGQHRARPACPPTAQVVAAMLEYLRADSIRPRTRDYLDTIKPRLDAIAAAFPALPGVTAAALENFLRTRTHRGRPISPKTFNHFRATFTLLWRFACVKMNIPLGECPAAAIAKLDAPGARDVWTPGELRLILDATPAAWIPAVTLSAFAGLRMCEIARLHWTDIYWRQREIRIRAEVAGKGGTPRNVPVCDTLAAWLTPWSRHVGPVYGLDQRTFRRKTEALHRNIERAVAGLRWKPNALRHSFGSYHIATHRNLELTRGIMGTGHAMLRHHYHSPQFADDAAAWWNIQPAGAANITTIHAAK